jgi:hypothetical protein
MVVPHETLMQITTLAKEAKGTYPASFILLNEKTNKARTFVITKAVDNTPIYTTPLAEIDKDVQLIALSSNDVSNSLQFKRRMEPVIWDEDRVISDDHAYTSMCGYAKIMGNRWEREHQERGGMPVKMIS